ncbi:MAG: hypothetical protein E7203_02840 [Selenomonas ruminantium]|uniref:ATP-grasp domain-containing protein n=1 Tax=Selenomonas ruminantium TaxID=971 RepID=A0A927WLB3_SELRU|nr:hypothetical protein [Selenomonas ruminantium]MBE6084400.1 hypothetical protein [Selenomonas ruminantium]
MIYEPEKEYYIMTPGLMQSRSIAYLLKSMGIKTIAVVDDDNIVRKHFFYEYYSDYININDLYKKIKGQKEVRNIIPTGAASTKKLLLKWNVRLGSVVATKENLLVFDKSSFLDRAETGGIKIPKTWTSVEDIPDNSYPIFYKQGVELGGGTRGVAYTKDDIPLEDNLIYQEYIDSKGTYGVGFLAKEGRIITYHAHWEKESYPQSGGSAVLIEIIKDQKLIKATEKLISVFAFSGWGLAEWKYNPRINDYVLMEINAKFWASCEFAFRNDRCFLKELFGCNKNDEYIDKMCFMELAFERGWMFMVRNILAIIQSKKILRCFSIKEVLFSFVPHFFRPIIKKTYNIFVKRS